EGRGERLAEYRRRDVGAGRRAEIARHEHDLLQIGAVAADILLEPDAACHVVPGKARYAPPGLRHHMRYRRIPLAEIPQIPLREALRGLATEGLRHAMNAAASLRDLGGIDRRDFETARLELLDQHPRRGGSDDPVIAERHEV